MAYKFIIVSSIPMTGMWHSSEMFGIILVCLWVLSAVVSVVTVLLMVERLFCTSKEEIQLPEPEPMKETQVDVPDVKWADFCEQVEMDHSDYISDIWVTSDA